MPTLYWCGSEYVARSAITSGSKTATSARMPSAMTPMSSRPSQRAGIEVIFMTASSRVITPSSRTYLASTRGNAP